MIDVRFWEAVAARWVAVVDKETRSQIQAAAARDAARTAGKTHAMHKAGRAALLEYLNSIDDDDDEDW